MKNSNALSNYSQNEWPSDKILLLHLWSRIPNTNLLVQTSLTAFFSKWLHFHCCHHLHQMLIAQKLSQGRRTKSWQWCKGSCEMITQDEINNSVLLLEDQQHNWKLLSQKWFDLQSGKEGVWGPDLVSLRFKALLQPANYAASTDLQASLPNPNIMWYEWD